MISSFRKKTHRYWDRSIFRYRNKSAGVKQARNYTRNTRRRGTLLNKGRSCPKKGSPLRRGGRREGDTLPRYVTGCNSASDWRTSVRCTHTERKYTTMYTHTHTTGEYLLSARVHETEVGDDDDVMGWEGRGEPKSRDTRMRPRLDGCDRREIVDN